MSDDDQQYGQGQGYDAQGRPYDAYPAPGAPAGSPAGAHWPQAEAQGPGPGQPQGSSGLDAAQTWQGQTWDTRYQPAIQPRPAPPAAGPQAQGGAAPYGTPSPEPAPYADPRYAGDPPYARDPYPAPQHTGVPEHAAPQPYGDPPYGDPQYAEPRYQAAHGAAHRPPATPHGGSGAYPLPPEEPVVAMAPVEPVAGTPGGAGAPAAPPAAAGAEEYGPATTLGNSRVTDAQRARAEGRSPIIAPGMQPAAITAGLGLLLALGAAIGPYALVVPLVLLQAVTAAGWFRLNGMWPARQGIALAFAGGFVADVVLLAAGRDNGPAALLGTLGVWVLLTLVLQLRSHAGADERMYGLTATVASAALAVLAAGHLAAAGDAVTVGALAVAVAVLVRALPLTGPLSVVVALTAAAGAGGAAGTFTDYGARAALLGLAAGVCALIGLRVASYDYPSRFVHMTAGVALPLTAAAPAVYLIGRALA